MGIGEYLKEFFTLMFQRETYGKDQRQEMRELLRPPPRGERKS